MIKEFLIGWLCIIAAVVAAVGVTLQRGWRRLKSAARTRLSEPHSVE